MRGISWLLMLLAMAMFTVGCDVRPSPPPPEAIDAATDLEVYEPLEEQVEEEAEEQAEPEEDEAMEPADATEEETVEEDTES